MNYTLSLFNSGQITLPKKFRDKFRTNKYVGVEKDGGIFIKPLFVKQCDIENYWDDQNVNFETDDSNWKVQFKNGIPAKNLEQELQAFVN